MWESLSLLSSVELCKRIKDPIIAHGEEFNGWKFLGFLQNFLKIVFEET